MFFFDTNITTTLSMLFVLDSWLVKLLLYRALLELIFVNLFLDDTLADLFAVLLEVALSHLYLKCLKLFHVLKLHKLVVHLFRNVGEYVEYHSNDDVENDPLH